MIPSTTRPSYKATLDDENADCPVTLAGILLSLRRDSKFLSTNSGGMQRTSEALTRNCIRRERDRPEERVGATTLEENRWGLSSREDAGIPLRDRRRETTTTTTTTPWDTINGRDEACPGGSSSASRARTARTEAAATSSTIFPVNDISRVQTREGGLRARRRRRRRVCI